MEVEPSLLFGPMWPALWWMRSAFIQFDHPVQPLVQICVWTRMSWPEILFNTAGIRDINHQRKPLIFWLSLSHLLHNANNNENKAKEQSSYIKESGLLLATKLITEVLSYRQTQKEMGGREVKKEEEKKKSCAQQWNLFTKQKYSRKTSYFMSEEFMRDTNVQPLFTVEFNK